MVCYSKGTFYSEDVGEMVKMHSTEPFFAPEVGGKFKLMNGTDKMLIFLFFCISKIDLKKLVQICIYGVINNVLTLQAL